MSFSVVLAVGPGAVERARLSDLLATLAAFEAKALREIIIVDDGAGLTRADFYGHPAHLLPLRIESSRRVGRGCHWRGGLATNIFWGFKQAWRQSGSHFLLKLDTDSLILRPCSSQIFAKFSSSNAKIGILGSCFLQNLHGDERPPSTWQVNLAKWMKRVRLRRNPFPHIETAIFGRNKRIRELILRALENGWPLGQCAQGGGYAVGARLLATWSRAGYLDDDFLWLHTDLTEDVISALLCYAAGHEISDFNSLGDPFGVQYRGLGFSVPDLFAREYGIVHSVKMPNLELERELRRELLGRLGVRTAFA
jgi:hypothetical protein